MNKAEVLKILDETKKTLIERGWHQGYFAIDKRRKHVSFMNESACAFCVLGAVFRAAGTKPVAGPLNALSAVAPGGSAAAYNDAPGRTKEDMLALIDKAKEWVNEQG